MMERVFTVLNRLGLHARPAAMFVQTTNKHQAQIMVEKDGQEVDGKSIMGILTLAAESGANLKISADGPDEAQALDALQSLFERRFDEE